MTIRSSAFLRLTLALLLFATIIGNSVIIYALSPEQKRIIDSGIRYFDVEKQTSTLGCNSSALAGSNNEEKTWNFLINHQLTPVQAAGVMGNLAVESAGLFEPRLVEYGWLNSRGEVSVQGQPSSLDDNIPPNQNILGQPGYGIVQWTSPSRKQGLQNKSDADVSKRRVSDLGLQLEFMYEEAVARDDWRKQQQADTVEGATLAWHNNYERSDDGPEKIQNRVNIAHAMLQKYGSTSSTSSGNPLNCAFGGSGEVVGGYSLPLDRIWYDRYPEWFRKAHHTYPASDIPVPEGTAVYSMSAGTIISAPVGGACGVGLIVDAGNGIIFKYCHGLDGGSISGAKKGDKVQPGQMIMTSGNTGRSSAPHLHVEIVVNGENRCPQPMFEGIVNGSPPDPATLPKSGCVE